MIKYPPVGKIAVTSCGSRIFVMGDEGDTPDCFTGDWLSDQDPTHRLSVFWRRDAIDHIEAPNEEDKKLIRFK